MTKLSKFTALAISLLIHLSAYASIEINGLFYELNSDAATASVVSKPDNTKYVGDITVPETIEHDSKTYNVTSVGESFINSPELTSLFLSKNCVSCEGVYGCSELKSFEWDITELKGGRITFFSKNNFINGCNKLERFICPNISVSNLSHSILSMLFIFLSNTVLSFNNCLIFAPTVPEYLLSYTSTMLKVKSSKYLTRLCISLLNGKSAAFLISKLISVLSI